VTARELLERATARIDSLAGQPLLQADLLNVIGPIYTQLGRFEKAAGLLERSAAIRRAQPGVDTLLPTTVNMWALALNNAGLRDSAAAASEHALELGLSILGEEHPTTIAMFNTLAIVRNRQGRDDEAEALYRRTIALQAKVLEKDHTDRTYPLNNLGLQFANQGRYREAEPLLREMQRILIANRGEEDALTAYSMENIGMLLREAGRYDEAEPVFRRGLAVRQKVLGPEHRFVGESYFSLGLLLALRGRPEDLAEADTLLPAALVIHRATLDPEHPAVGFTLYAMGILAAQQGDTAAAVRRFREALSIRRQNRDAPRETVRTLVELGTLLRRGGDAGADSALREAHDLARDGLPAGDPVRSRAAIALAQLIAARENLAEAGPIHREALIALRDRIGADHPIVRAACAEGAALGLDSGDACPTLASSSLAP
jgi:tetratricopeptide (TPR) repeat protein